VPIWQATMPSQATVVAWRCAWFSALADPHPVLGQHAGLVSTYHGGGPECLDRRQPRDQRTAPGHLADADREGERDGGQQAFRDVSHQQAGYH
jgi:hypothetical protein